MLRVSRPQGGGLGIHRGIGRHIESGSKEITVPRKPKEENDQLAKAVGAQITKAMDRLNITVSELHKRTGISRTVLLAYTRGTYAPGARELKLLCEQLDVTPTVLLFGSNQVATTPYKLGDLALSETGAQTVAFLLLLSQLTQGEKLALLTLAESLSAARNPAEHRKLLSTLDVLLKTEQGQAIIQAMGSDLVASLPIAELEEQIQTAIDSSK